MAELKCRGKAAIVTGGSSGIGEAIVRCFASQGAAVVFCSNQETEGRELEKQLRADASNRVTFILYDAKNEDDIKNVVDKTIAIYGRIDYLVNNVGVHPPHFPIDSFSSEDFKTILDINVVSCFLTTKYAITHLRETKGCIINTASLVATLGQHHAVTYCATKGAILSMTKALAIDEAKYGVRVNCISPGNIWTPLWESVAKKSPNPEAVIKLGENQQLFPRMGTAEECALACLYLATDATYITGIDLPISAGAELSFAVKSCEIQL